MPTRRWSCNPWWISASSVDGIGCSIISVIQNLRWRKAIFCGPMSSCAKAVSGKNRSEADSVNNQMKVLGLTGGIGMGKSTAAELLRARAVPVVDTDELARQVVEPGQPALAEVVAAFGPE